MGILLALIVVANILVSLAWLCAPKESAVGQWLGAALTQFRFNAYIRWYMFAYFDLTFFAVLKLLDGNQST